MSVTQAAAEVDILIDELKRSSLTEMIGRSRDGLYEPVLAESEREAVAELLQFLENV